jgi:hypothetical protein
MAVFTTISTIVADRCDRKDPLRMYERSSSIVRAS